MLMDSKCWKSGLSVRSLKPHSWSIVPTLFVLFFSFGFNFSFTPVAASPLPVQLSASASEPGDSKLLDSSRNHQYYYNYYIISSPPPSINPLEKQKTDFFLKNLKHDSNSPENLDEPTRGTEQPISLQIPSNHGQKFYYFKSLVTQPYDNDEDQNEIIPASSYYSSAGSSGDSSSSLISTLTSTAKVKAKVFDQRAEKSNKNYNLQMTSTEASSSTASTTITTTTGKVKEPNPIVQPFLAAGIVPGFGYQQKGQGVFGPLSILDQFGQLF